MDQQNNHYQIPFAIVPIEVAMDERLTKSQLRVLIALLSFRGRDTNQMWPKRETIAERCGLSDNHISKITGELEELGWLKKAGKGGFSRATKFTFQVPEFNNAKEPLGHSNPYHTVRGSPYHTVRGNEQTSEQTNGTDTWSEADASDYAIGKTQSKSRRTKFPNKDWSANGVNPNEVGKDEDKGVLPAEENKEGLASANNEVALPASDNEKGPSAKSGKSSAPALKERNRKYRPAAAKLSRIIRTSKNVKVSSKKINSWANDIRLMAEQDGIDLDRLHAALDWYADNIGGKFVPVIESARTLREKFLKLENAIERTDQPDKSRPSKKSPPDEGARPRPKYVNGNDVDGTNSPAVRHL